MEQPNKPETNQTKAALHILMAVADSIRELGQVPSGHLYTMLLGKLDLNQYDMLIGILKRSGLVKESTGHLLTWTGPAKVA